MLYDPAHAHVHDGMHWIMNAGMSQHNNLILYVVIIMCCVTSGKDLGMATEADLRPCKLLLVNEAMATWRKSLPIRVRRGRRTPQTLHAIKWTSSETYLFLRLRGWEYCFTEAANAANEPLTSFMNADLFSTWTLLSELVVVLFDPEGVIVKDAQNSFIKYWEALLKMDCR